MHLSEQEWPGLEAGALWQDFPIESSEIVSGHSGLSSKGTLVFMGDHF